MYVVLSIFVVLKLVEFLHGIVKSLRLYDVESSKLRLDLKCCFLCGPNLPAAVYKEDDDEIGDEEIPIMDGGDGMEIGFPTDVKHITHIGLDGAATSLLSPNWRQPTADVDLFSRQNLLSTGNDSPHPPPAVAMVAAPGGMLA
nr:CRIB domain-containing protein RIC4-like [Ipomoea batatas]